MDILVLLERGESFQGKAVNLDNATASRCKVFFRGKNQELGIATDVDISGAGHEKAAELLSALNGYLLQLHQEANMEFPEWLEKHSTRANEANPFFNLDEIREEYKFKKSRFGVWRKAATIGFFTDMRSNLAEFNKIVHLEIKGN